MLFNSNTTGATSGAEAAYHSRKLASFSVFCLFFSFLFWPEYYTMIYKDSFLMKQRNVRSKQLKRHIYILVFSRHLFFRLVIECLLFNYIMTSKLHVAPLWHIFSDSEPSSLWSYSAANAIFIFFGFTRPMCPSVMLNSLSSSFTSISFLNMFID